MEVALSCASAAQLASATVFYTQSRSPIAGTTVSEFGFSHRHCSRRQKGVGMGLAYSGICRSQEILCINVDVPSVGHRFAGIGYEPQEESVSRVRYATAGQSTSFRCRVQGRDSIRRVGCRRREDPALSVARSMSLLSGIWDRALHILTASRFNSKHLSQIAPRKSKPRRAVGTQIRSDYSCPLAIPSLVEVWSLDMPQNGRTSFLDQRHFDGGAMEFLSKKQKQVSFARHSSLDTFAALRHRIQARMMSVFILGTRLRQLPINAV